MKLQLKSHCLYILSGIPASGKSTLLKNSNIPDSCVISSDALRIQLLGSYNFLHENQIKSAPYASEDSFVFDIMHKMVEARIRQHLITFIDATCVDKKSRQRWVDLAQKYNFPFEILILDTPLDVALVRNKNRQFFVPDQALKYFYNRLEKKYDKYHCKILDQNISELEIIPNQLLTYKVDIINSISVDLKSLNQFLYKNNYKTDSKKSWIHKDDRKLLFLGNFLHQNFKNLDILNQIYLAVTFGNHFAIIGQNEFKLVQMWLNYQKHKILDQHNQQLKVFLNLDIFLQNTLIKFLQNLPAYYLIKNQKVAIVHGNVQTFDPLTTPKQICVFGSDRINHELDSDKIYQDHYDKNINQYQIIRGFKENTSNQKAIFSLENKKQSLEIIKLDELF